METFDISKMISSAPAPLVIGAVLTIFLKMLKTTPHVPDWSLPYWAVAVGSLVNGALWGFTPRNIVEGIMIGGFAVFGNQIFRQTKERFGQTQETREFRRRWDEMKEEAVAKAEAGGPQSVIVTTPAQPSQPSKVEVIAKQKPVDPTA